MDANVQYQNKSVTTVFFTDGSTGPDYDGNIQVALLNATITTTINTADANVQVWNTETIQQPAGVVAGEVTLVTSVLTSDPNVVIATTPIVSDANVLIHTTGVESIDANTGLHLTQITSVISTNDVTLDVYCASTVTLPSTTALIEPQYRYLILRHDLIDGYLHGNPGGDFNMTCQEMYSLMNFACVKLSEGLYQTLMLSWSKEEVIELDINTATFGTVFFSEIRPVAKLWEAKTSWYGEKVPTEITPEIQGYILTVMKAFSTEIVEAEFERRYLAMRGASDFEADTWAIQREEAEAYTLNNSAPTPFLDALSTARGISKATLVTSIQTNTATYYASLATMLGTMQNVLDRFKNCTTVWDINILYEDYFGIAMPISEAIALGRTVSADNWARLPQWSVKGNGCYF